MKKHILFTILLFSAVISVAQNRETIDSLYQKLHDEVNIVDPAVKISDIVWERIPFPDSSSVFDIALSSQHNIVIGSGAGVYLSAENDINWNFLGLGNMIIHSVAVNNNGDLYAGASQAPGFCMGLYRSTDNGLNWIEVLPDIGVYGNVTKIIAIGDTIFASLCPAEGARIIRSTDNCQTWDLVFALDNSSEYVSDILIADSGKMYVSLKAYFEDMGGVYMSPDWGNTWEYSGLFNHMVSCLARNSSDDIFAGSWGLLGPEGWPGLYVLRNGQTQWDTLIWGPQVDDMVINEDDAIYFSSTWPNGVVVSYDNGENFELINEGLTTGSMGNMEINDEGFIYITTKNITSYLARTINTTVSVPEKGAVSTNNSFTVFPNPVKNLLNIRLNDNNSATGEVFVSVFDTKGKLYLSKKIYTITNNIQLDAGHFIPGMYIVEITGNSTKSYKKIIKQ